MNKLQKVLLIILSDVDKLLKENNIPYFLDGGSALGAVRHKGFIPWDDDLDICVLPDDYSRFVKVCREKLDKEKYSFEEAEVDWPLPFSKIKLKGTYIDEVDAYPSKDKGIFIDIYCAEYARRTQIGKFLQYLLGRLYAACFLSKKGYTTNSIKKKIVLRIAGFINNSNLLSNFLRSQVRGRKESNELSLVWDRTRPNWRSYFYDKKLFSSVVLMDFEGHKFPICRGYDKYLTQLYGDYMKLPSKEKQVGLHIKKIDFGKYGDQ